MTGAGGYIGRAVVTRLLERGYNVVALVHSPQSVAYDDPHVKWVVGDMRDPHTVGRFVANADIVVHLAARKSDERDSEVTNIRGAQILVDACKTAGVRGIVNVSTISTKLANAGVYGRTKCEADRIIATGPVPSRTLLLSIVYDDRGGGIFGTLLQYARLPVIPVIGSGEITFRPIHAADVANAIELLVATPMAGHRTYELGGPDRVSFNMLALTIGRKVRGVEPKLLHVPLGIGLALAKLLRLFFLKPPITESNVLGMAEDIEVDSGAFLRDHGLHPRTLTTGLATLEQPIRLKHNLMSEESLEAFALLTYVSGGTPREADVASYKTAAAHFDLADHHISPWLLRSALLLGAFDAVTKLAKPRGVFQRKMLIAAALYECTPQSSEKLLPRRRTISSLIRSGIFCAARVVGKLALGFILVCIPGFYKRNA